MKQRAWFILPAILISVSVARPISFETVKVWKFAQPHGSLRIELKASSDGSSSLGIAPDGQTLEAPIVEQIQPLKQVLSEMPGLGLDPHKLSYLGTRLFTEDVYQKLAYACVDSSEWRRAMSNGGKGKEGLVVELLNQSGAYEPYNVVFKTYGIRVQVTEAEKVGLMRFSKVPPRTSEDRSNAMLWVPADAMLGMRFSPMSDDK